MYGNFNLKNENKAWNMEWGSKSRDNLMHIVQVNK